MKFKVGDRVTITGKYRKYPWVNGMHYMCGKQGVVKYINHIGNVRVAVPNEVGYSYNPVDLESTSYVPEDLFQI